MSIYKVRVKRTESMTTYVTNSTELARIESELDHYIVKQDGVTLATVSTYEEAEKEARNAVAHLMESVGAAPNFINEEV